MDESGKTANADGFNYRPVHRGPDGRLKWMALPLTALALLAAYLVGTQVTPNAPEEPAVVDPTAPRTGVPVARDDIPRGIVTITELPSERAPTPRPITPPPTAAPRPAPKPEPAVQEEAPVVLPPEAPDQPTSGADQRGAPDQPAPAQPPPAATPPATPEPPRPPAGVNRDPVQTNNPAQEYPAAAYEEQVQGQVRVSFTITEGGNVVGVQVARSSGDDRLDRAAVSYVNRLRFRPALKNGSPSATTATRTVTFSLR